jgi:hypothetical protein
VSAAYGRGGGGALYLHLPKKSGRVLEAPYRPVMSLEKPMDDYCGVQSEMTSQECTQATVPVVNHTLAEF